MAAEEIYNFIKVSDEIVTAGQPTVEQLRSLAAEGFTTVINLATIDPARSPANEAELVRTQGMTYYHIPVDWENPQDTDFATFAQIMLQLPAGKTLIHCVANYRVTAFYSLYAQKYLGWSAAQADDFRAAIWKDSDYPIWREFVARNQALILAQP